MRFRYRAYTGGPDPLADPDPPPEEAVRAAVELLELIAGETEEPVGALAATEAALRRYADGERGALDEVDARALQAALGSAGYGPLDRLDSADHGLSPRELRRLGEVALTEIEAARRAAPGGHRGGDGAGDEPTGAAVPHDGFDRPLDAVATLREAMLRRAAGLAPGEALRAEDVRYTGTEPAGAAAVCLLVDLSHSMVTRGLHEAATRTALALHTLVRTRHPEDRLLIIGFGDRAREMTPAELAEHDWRRTPAPTSSTRCTWPGGTCAATEGCGRWSWRSPTANPPRTWARTATPGSPGRPPRARWRSPRPNSTPLWARAPRSRSSCSPTTRGCGSSRGSSNAAGACAWCTRTPRHWARWSSTGM